MGRERIKPYALSANWEKPKLIRPRPGDPGLETEYPYSILLERVFFCVHIDQEKAQIVHVMSTNR